MRIKLIFNILLSISSFTVINAQPGSGDDPDVPIDGGVSLLVAAGVGYGIKKLYNKKKSDDGQSASDK